MNRIDRQTLYHLVASVIHFAPKPAIKGLRMLGVLDGPGSLDAVTRRVCDQIDNERRAVVQIASDPGIPFETVFDASPRAD